MLATPKVAMYAFGKLASATTKIKYPFVTHAFSLKF